ncbi:MAG: hypothetical protein WKF43_15685 [Acidimicrobiales bacterium]
MTEDRHDAQIRNLVAELAGSAPPAPAFSRIAERLPAPTGAVTMAGVDTLDGELGDESLDLTPSYVTERTPRSRPWRLMAAFVASPRHRRRGVRLRALSEGDGAETPEAAVERFVDAFAQSDVTGILESWPPASGWCCGSPWSRSTARPAGSS